MLVAASEYGMGAKPAHKLLSDRRAALPGARDPSEESFAAHRALSRHRAGPLLRQTGRRRLHIAFVACDGSIKWVLLDYQTDLAAVGETTREEQEVP
jgi:hypothetical protein